MEKNAMITANKMIKVNVFDFKNLFALFVFSTASSLYLPFS